MARFILRYGGSPSAPESHVKDILATRGTRVVDKSPNMLLVDGDESALRTKMAELPGWSINPEKSIPLPDTRKRIR